MLRLAFYLLLGSTIAAVLAVGGLLWWVLPELPDAAKLRDVRLQTPLQVFTSDGALLAEFGEKRRNPVTIGEVPAVVRQAFIAAEDERFYEHPGVDWVAMARAVADFAITRQKRRGASTITMQVARNFFLTPEKTFGRKLREVVLAMRIERNLTKDEILELYLNKIFLGQRAYGVAAAAQVYYGKSLSELSLDEAAMLAALPKAPSTVNPIANPDAAMIRRSYVLRRMLELGFVQQAAFEEAMAAPQKAELHGAKFEVEAPYIAEMVRTQMEAEFGEEAYTQGYRVYTTVGKARQDAAVAALRKTLLDYDRRHGYRGPEARVELAAAEQPRWAEKLAPWPARGGLDAVLVSRVEPKAVEALDRRGKTLRVEWDGLAWARKRLGDDAVGPAPRKAGDVVAVGDVIRVQWHQPAPDKKNPAPAGYWRLAQLPEVEGALVSVATHDGAIQALVGGFAFEKSKFNRATQALRQPGSNFKPFIYSAALDNGFTPASFVNDAPIVFEAPGLEGAWRPENYTGNYYGPMRLRDALANSRNLVSIRLMRELGVEKVIEHVSRFGFVPASLPHNLSLSLGTGEVTPINLAAGYAAFANGGFLVKPYVIERIETDEGRLVRRAAPAVACADCTADGSTGEDGGTTPAAAPRAVDAQNAYLMYMMMKDVISRGTARQAMELGRKDLAGKTGTTNDQRDAWFSGFNANLATTVWVGFDSSGTLGNQETGARAALPMWIDFMRAALRGQPEADLPRPPGVVTVRIDPDTGGLTGIDNPRGILESFREKDIPGPDAPPPMPGDDGLPAGGSHGVGTGNADPATDQLF